MAFYNYIPGINAQPARGIGTPLHRAPGAVLPVVRIKKNKKKHHDYRQFVSEQKGKGLTLTEIALMWNKLNGQDPSPPPATRR